MNSTNEFSFILKTSTIPKAGIGIFALHDIKAGTKLIIWGNKHGDEDQARELKKEIVPEELRGYCVIKDADTLLCPENFSHMSVGWYLNHSTNPNVLIKNNKYFFAARDISKGEELFIDYNYLGEPENAKENYYKIS